MATVGKVVRLHNPNRFRGLRKKGPGGSDSRRLKLKLKLAKSKPKRKNISNLIIASNPNKRRVKNVARKMTPLQKLYFTKAGRKKLATSGRVNPSFRKTKKRAKKLVEVDGQGVLVRCGEGLLEKHLVREKKRKNVAQGFFDSSGFHPIRSSWDYDPDRANEFTQYASQRKQVGGKRKKKGAKKGTMARKRKVSAKRRRRNPVVNPRRRYRRRRASAGVTRRNKTHRRRRTNPKVVVRYRNRASGRRRYSRRRKNPSLAAFRGVPAMAKNAVFAIAGAVGARTLTQMVLRDRNKGIFGYLGNTVAAIVLGMVAGRFVRDKSIAQSIVFGGVLGTVLRAIQEYTPLGQYAALSGLGDAGIGAIVPSTFYVPLNYSGMNMNQLVAPGQIAQVAGSLVRTGNGMKGLGGGRYGSAGRYS